MLQTGGFQTFVLLHNVTDKVVRENWCKLKHKPRILQRSLGDRRSKEGQSRVRMCTVKFITLQEQSYEQNNTISDVLIRLLQMTTSWTVVIKMSFVNIRLDVFIFMSYSFTMIVYYAFMHSYINI